MTNSKMSLWSFISDMPPERFSNLFEEFPHNLRCLLGEWLENQPWEFINRSDTFSAVMAASLLSAMMERLQDLANENYQPGPVVQLIANVENKYQREPLQLVGVIKRILEREHAAVQEQFQHLPLSIQRRREELMFGFSLQKLQYKVQEIQALRENLGQMNGSSRVPLQLNSLDPQCPAQENLQGTTLQNLQTLLLNTVSELEEAKKVMLVRLLIWKRQQQLAGNGTPFDEDLAPLQKRLENLVDVCFQLRLHLAASGIEVQSRLQERLDNVFSALIKNSFLVDKQPPQVLKTQTKFQATVRFLLGPQLLKPPHTSFTVAADIVTEKQAREIAASHPGAVFNESTGEIVNNTAPLETNATSNACCALFKNMLLKKIKRCDRKSTESVTEEKCAILFSASVSLGPNKTNFHLKSLSLPIVVIVHGNQDNNAKATILWDNAFAEPTRIPFVVAERVSWDKMCETLNQKFMAEVQTTKCLLKEHYFFLAQKIFGDSVTSPEEFQKRPVSWSQFNKEMLPGRGFTFWQWFEGVLDLTKKYLKDYWSDRLIMGFVSKQYVSSCLNNAPVGAFLLRFSDSEIGGISIAYVTYLQNGSTQVENIQPFTSKQLYIRSLADCIMDLSQLKTLYPARPKHEAFGRHYNTFPPTAEKPTKTPYVPARLTITVGPTSLSPTPSIPNPANSMSNPHRQSGMLSEPAYHDHLRGLQSALENWGTFQRRFGGHAGVMVASGEGSEALFHKRYPSACEKLILDATPKQMIMNQPAMGTSYGSSQLPLELPSHQYSLGNASPLGPMETYPPLDVDMDCLPDFTPMCPMDQLHVVPSMIGMPDTISPPSKEDLDYLLNPEHNLNHYCQDPA